MNGTQCDGLRAVAAVDVEACRNACCSASNCEVYQFCPKGAACVSAEPCWIGQLPTSNPACNKAAGWISGARTEVPPSPPHGGGGRPADQPCPASPTCVGYADVAWRDVNTPHDFIVEGTFSPDVSDICDPGSLALFPCGG
jgi:hypothetical protein